MSMVEHNCNISILEAEAGGLQYPGHHGLCSVDSVLEINTILIISRQNGNTSFHSRCWALWLTAYATECLMILEYGSTA